MYSDEIFINLTDMGQRIQIYIFRPLYNFDEIRGRDRGERGSIPLLASTDPATYAGARKLKLERKWARGSWRILARGRGWNLPCRTSKREREGEGDG